MTETPFKTIKRRESINGSQKSLKSFRAIEKFQLLRSKLDADPMLQSHFRSCPGHVKGHQGL
jgi:hypothetical protein